MTHSGGGEHVLCDSTGAGGRGDSWKLVLGFLRTSHPPPHPPTPAEISHSREHIYAMCRVLWVVLVNHPTWGCLGDLGTSSKPVLHLQVFCLGRSFPSILYPVRNLGASLVLSLILASC